MQPASVPTVYLRLRKRLSIRRGEAVLLGQAAQLIADPAYEEALHRIVLYRPRENDGNIVLIDMMLIVERIRASYPLMQIEHFGEPHCLVEVGDPPKPPNIIFIIIVWLLLFIGSGLAIMNFHADVSMAEVHARIYRLVTGLDNDRPLLLQIPYSIGIGVGMVVFFNHLFKKKFNEEPSPLDVEVFLYQESVNHYIVTEEYGKMHDRTGAT
ncbi:stage V sporulation protein AA [Paenibacillus ginsengihumi]|uniref:stage V sporulation protein AA n=1 Tax=Paenibacillus ginsengihumi TaxID=431596 RepID=UPI00036BD212|nr:stage V sporulation protein AA [Paenibacillus ginsengihumi]